MSDAQNLVIADTSSSIAVTTEQCIMASSPDMSVTSTSFSEERNSATVANVCSTAVLSSRSDNDAEVTSSCEDLAISESNSMMTSFLVRGKMPSEEVPKINTYD